MTQDANKRTNRRQQDANTTPTGLRRFEGGAVQDPRCRHRRNFRGRISMRQEFPEPHPPASKETLRHNRKRTGLPSLSPSGVAATCWPLMCASPLSSIAAFRGKFPALILATLDRPNTPPRRTRSPDFSEEGLGLPAIEAPAGKECLFLRIRSRRMPEDLPEDPSEGQHPRRRNRQRERQNSRSGGQSLDCPRNGGLSGFRSCARPAIGNQ